MIVKVKWIDTGTYDGWLTPSEMVNWAEKRENFHMETVGKLIVDSPEFVVVAPTTHKVNGTANNPTRISRACIIGLECIDGEDPKYNETN